MNRVVEKIESFIPERPQFLKVAAYARVSTGKETMLHSLSAQVSYYSEMIQSHNGWIYCGVYTDEALTGTKEKRESFQRLLEDCRQGKIDLIITKSISRFARNTVVLLETVRELKRMNIDVYFEEQNIHTISAEGELMLTILASYAQEESLSVSENMKWRVRNNFEQGIPWNGTVLGYRIENGRYVVVEDEARIVRLIYKLYLLGLGYKAISDELNDRGLKTRNGNEWTHASVLWVLHNYSYTGNLMLQRTFTENHITKKYRFNNGEYPMYHAEETHEAIVPIEVFTAVQEEASKRSEKFSKVENKNKTEFTRRIFCDKCGMRCRRKLRHGNPIWICNTYNTKGKDVCAAKAVPEVVLNELEKRYSPEKYYLCDNNEIKVVLMNGETVIEKWKDRSRAESWTKEMRKEQGDRRRAAWRMNERLQ